MTDATASKASVDGSLHRFTEDRASEPDNPRHAGWPDLPQPASRRGQLRSATGTCAPDAFLLPVPACGTYASLIETLIALALHQIFGVSHFQSSRNRRAPWKTVRISTDSPLRRYTIR